MELVCLVKYHPNLVHILFLFDISTCPFIFVLNVFFIHLYTCDITSTDSLIDEETALSSTSSSTGVHEIVIPSGSVAQCSLTFSPKDVCMAIYTYIYIRNM